MRFALALLFTLAALGAAPAHAQGAMAAAQTALDDVEVVGCLDDASLSVDALGLTVLRVAVVVHPDGLWSLALGTQEELALTDVTRRDALQHCLESQLDVLLPTPIPAPPRAASVVSRSVVDPTPAEHEVLGFVRTQRPTIEACLYAGEHPVRRRLATRLHVALAADGTPRVTGRGRDAALIARCVLPSLAGVQLDGGSADVDVAFHPPPLPPEPGPVQPPTLPRADGTEGAICGWGQRRADWTTLPEPRPCRRGLTCCTAGGAAGSDAVCMNVGGPGQCPAFP